MAVPTREGFRRALAGTPMAREADSIYDVARRGGINPALVVGIAGAESNFGRLGYAVGRNNPYGLMGFRFSNYTQATDRLVKTLNSGSLGYRAAYGRSGLNGMINIYTPRGAANGPNNDPDSHTRNIINIGRKSGGDPSRAYITPGAAPAAAPSAARPEPAGTVGGGFDSSRLIGLMRQQTERIKSGQGYDRELGLQVRQAVIDGIGQRNIGGGNVPPAGLNPQPQAGGATGDVNLDALGIGYGGVDSRKITRGGVGGNWGGSMPRALQFLDWAKQSGYQPNTSGRWLSQKRARQNTASGGISDHWQGSTQSYGLDLGVPNLAEGDKLIGNLMRYFGQPNYKGGSWLNVNKGGYRYQIGWRTPGHFDHIHVGVKKL